MDRRLTTLRIPAVDRESLAMLANLSADARDTLLNGLSSVRRPLSERELRQHLEEHVPSMSQADLTRVVDVLLTLLSVRANLAGAAVDVPDLVATSEQLKLDEERRAELKILLSRLLNLQPLILAWKAFDVLSEHERTFHSARTVSEIRPLFADAATDPPKAAVIVHTLRLTYHTDNGELKEFFVGLDNTDLTALIGVLARAQQKATTLNELLTTMGLPTINPVNE